MNLSPLRISLQVSFVATIFTFLLGTWTGYRVAKMKKLKGLIDGIFTLPMVLPPTVVGFFLLLIFGKNGWIGQFLNRIGIAVVFTWQGAVIAAAVVSFPLMYRTARGAFEQMDQNLIYAGRTLGMRESTIFWRIIFPNCWSGIVSGTILAFARAFGEFGATSMLAGNIPGRTQTMSLAIYSAVAGNNRERAYMWVGIIMGISFVTIFLMNVLMDYQNGKRRRRNG